MAININQYLGHGNNAAVRFEFEGDVVFITFVARANASACFASSFDVLSAKDKSLYSCKWPKEQRRELAADRIATVERVPAGMVETNSGNQSINSKAFQFVKVEERD